HQNVDANVLIGNALARERVVLAVYLDERPKRSLPRILRGMNREGRERFGIGRFHFHRNGSRFDPPAFWRLEPELAADGSRRSRDAYLDRLRFVVAKNENGVLQIREDRRRDDKVLAHFADDGIDRSIFRFDQIPKVLITDAQEN